jgi:hypothetical protein
MGRISQTTKSNNRTTKDHTGVLESCSNSMLWIKTNNVATPHMNRVTVQRDMTDATRERERRDRWDRYGKPYRERVGILVIVSKEGNGKDAIFQRTLTENRKFR